MQFLDILNLFVIAFFVKIELSREVFLWGENVGHKEVEETPQLSEVILKWCTRKQKASARADVSRVFENDRLFIFEFMGLVEKDYVEEVLG